MLMSITPEACLIVGGLFDLGYPIRLMLVKDGNGHSTALEQVS
jgi:hypothetical protein